MPLENLKLSGLILSLHSTQSMHFRPSNSHFNNITRVTGCEAKFIWYDETLHSFMIDISSDVSCMSGRLSTAYYINQTYHTDVNEPSYLWLEVFVFLLEEVGMSQTGTWVPWCWHIGWWSFLQPVQKWMQGLYERKKTIKHSRMIKFNRSHDKSEVNMFAGPIISSLARNINAIVGDNMCKLETQSCS